MPPMSELKADMENLRRHGFNLVKLQEQWALDEAIEGQYDFGAYEELIEYAARLDMGRWCIAPVRSDIPAPPPGGIERRRKERMALELAGICLGLIEQRFAHEAAERR